MPDTSSSNTANAAIAGRFTIGGEFTIARLGFGAMRITGRGIWGEPADRDECLRVLRRLPELIVPGVEEFLRFESSVQFWPTRTALEDIEIAGTTIPKGSPVIPVYGSGNRDPNRFTNPDQVDLEREDNEHLGYGRGIHLCFGGPLARLEVQIAVGELVRRVRNPRLVVDPPPYRHNQIFRGPRHVLVDIDGVSD